MNTINVVSVRRWSWIPFIHKTVYVPVFHDFNPDKLTPQFELRDSAIHFLNLLEECCK